VGWASGPPVTVNQHQAREGTRTKVPRKLVGRSLFSLQDSGGPEPHPTTGGNALQWGGPRARPTKGAGAPDGFARFEPSRHPEEAGRDEPIRFTMSKNTNGTYRIATFPATDFETRAPGRDQPSSRPSIW
jgi:hypothetical protein